jgi:hypothetical protein
MHATKLSGLVGLLSALALSACATTPASVGISSEPTYVASVEVIQSDASVPDGFSDALRTVVLNEAAFYGTTGRPITVRIDVNHVHFKNVLQALIIGDNNDVRGQVTVLDASAQQMANFPVRVDAERSHGVSGAGLAMGVLEVLDPTGLLAVAHTVGSASSADINRSGTAVAMRANFADETLRQTFGDVRTRAVIRARQEELRNAHH